MSCRGDTALFTYSVRYARGNEIEQGSTEKIGPVLPDRPCALLSDRGVVKQTHVPGVPGSIDHSSKLTGQKPVRRVRQLHHALATVVPILYII